MTAKQRRTPTDRKPPPAPTAALVSTDENKPKYEIVVRIDRDALTWGDMFLISSFQDNPNRKITNEEMLDLGYLLNRFVEGGIKKFPMAATGELLNAFFAAMKEDAEAKN